MPPVVGGDAEPTEGPRQEFQQEVSFSDFSSMPL